MIPGRDFALGACADGVDAWSKWPDLARVTFQRAELGREAGRMLLQLLEDPRAELPSVVQRGPWLARATALMIEAGAAGIDLNVGCPSSCVTRGLRGAALLKDPKRLHVLLAAMVAAVRDIPAGAGTISFIITGDEEGPAKFGTLALMDHMRGVNAIPDLCLVGEPTSVNRLGDMVKIGRRGSVNIWLDVEGVQGHVAYPHLADNPIPRLIAMLAELDTLVLDEGTDWFQASNLEITDLAVGNQAHNVIPARAGARISIRFNDLHTGERLFRRIAEIAERHGGTARAVISGEAFLTKPGTFSELVTDAIEAETGLKPELSTSGGTSDARFLKALCPVIEFGLCNATMHKRDEAVALDDLEALARIYRRIVGTALKG